MPDPGMLRKFLDGAHVDALEALLRRAGTGLPRVNGPAGIIVALAEQRR